MKVEIYRNRSCEPIIYEKAIKTRVADGVFIVYYEKENQSLTDMYPLSCISKISQLRINPEINYYENN